MAETPRFTMHTADLGIRAAQLERLKESQWAEVEIEGVELPIHLRVGVTEEGRFACTGLIIGPFGGEPSEILARDLRRIPLGEIMAFIAADVAGDTLPEDMEPGARAVYLAFNQWHVALPADRIPPRARPGPQGHPREHFERVAAVYRRAVLERRSPVRAVMEEIGASESTAHRWIQRARDMEILGASIQGKAGERKPKKKGAKPKEGPKDTPSPRARTRGRRSREALRSKSSRAKPARKGSKRKEPR